MYYLCFSICSSPAFNKGFRACYSCPPVSCIWFFPKPPIRQTSFLCLSFFNLCPISCFTLKVPIFLPVVSLDCLIFPVSHLLRRYHPVFLLLLLLVRCLSWGHLTLCSQACDLSCWFICPSIIYTSFCCSGSWGPLKPTSAVFRQRAGARPGQVYQSITGPLLIYGF